MCNTTQPLFLFTTLLSERPVRHTPAFFLFTTLLSERLVLHTPAFNFVHSFAIGTAGSTHPGLRPPLSKRGWRGSDLLISKRGWRGSDLLIIKTMRQPIPSRRGVAEGRGVSHCRTSTIRGVSRHQTSTIQGVSYCQTTIIKHLSQPQP